MTKLDGAQSRAATRLGRPGPTLLPPVARQELAEQRDVNRQLQYAILPWREAGIAVNGMRIAVRYEGADHSVDVGGDWYLTEPLPGGDLLLAVGDVVGHGLAATATMVRLRNAAAGLAVAGHGPGGILRVLNRLLCQQDDDAAATAVVATYNPRTRRLTWARAGHVPILIANRDDVRPLWHPVGAILGVLPDAEYPLATMTLRADDVLVMYTDAFVEGPGLGLDDGVRALAEHTRRTLEGAALDPLVDRPTAVADGLRRRNRRDDACLLAAELVG
jgi:serine phosphatase RsbU (regulator of sigma subunit)